MGYYFSLLTLIRTRVKSYKSGQGGVILTPLIFQLIFLLKYKCPKTSFLWLCHYCCCVPGRYKIIQIHCSFTLYHTRSPHIPLNFGAFWGIFNQIPDFSRYLQLNWRVSTLCIPTGMWYLLVLNNSHEPTLLLSTNTNLNGFTDFLEWKIWWMGSKWPPLIRICNFLPLSGWGLKQMV